MFHWKLVKFQDRAALMSLILEDESKRQKLNGITHPRIFRRMLWEIAGFASKGHNYAVLDVPLLFESSKKLSKWFHKIIGAIQWLLWQEGAGGFSLKYELLKQYSQKVLQNQIEIWQISNNMNLNCSWALLRRSVIQANGRMAFEDGLRSGGPLHYFPHCNNICNYLADIMDTLKKFKVAILSRKWDVSWEIHPAVQGAHVEQ